MNVVTILMMSVKVTDPGLLKRKVFWNKVYDVIISVHYLTNKSFFMWHKFYCRCDRVTKVWFGTSSISMIEKTVALGRALKFCTSVVKELKLKIRKFWWLIPTFVRVTGKELVGALFTPILNRVQPTKLSYKLSKILKIATVTYKEATNHLLNLLAKACLETPSTIPSLDKYTNNKN